MIRGVLALLLAFASASAWASLADQIVEPHTVNLLDARAGRNFEQSLGITRATWRTAQGADLGYRIIPVAARGMSYVYARTAHGASFHFTSDPDVARHMPAPAMRGTVVYLHGWESDASSMLGWALALADRGYAGLSVDLRNHGESSRAPVGFGPREAGDIVALLDALRARGELHEPVFLFGVSYGASTALFAEAGLRGKLAGIVAMEPYANAADAVRTLVPGMLAQSRSGIGGHLMSGLARRHYTPAVIEQAIVEVDHRLGIDLATIDLHAPMAQSRTCTLLLHGARDTFIPATASRGLAAAAPSIHYTELASENHLSLPVRMDWLAHPIAIWLGQAGGGQCQDLVLPPDPASVRSQQPQSNAR